MNRILQDIELIKTKALPAAGASASTDSIEIGSTCLENVQVKVSVVALPSLADAKKNTVTIEDSADNITFAAVPELATLVQTGAGGVGAAAASMTVYLPPSARKYVRATDSVDALGGDNTAKTMTLQFLF
jgi:hypothetical protein